MKMEDTDFLAIFNGESHNSLCFEDYYHQEFTIGEFDVIECDTFISSLVDIMLEILNSNGNYIPPYDDFNEVDYMDKLVSKLKKMKEEDFKGCLSMKGTTNQKKKSEEYAEESNKYAMAMIYDQLLGRANNLGLNAVNLLVSDLSESKYADIQLTSKKTSIPNLGNVYKEHNAYDWIRKGIDIVSEKGINAATQLSSNFGKDNKYIPSECTVFMYGQAASVLMKSWVTLVERVSPIMPNPVDAAVSAVSLGANFCDSVRYDYLYRKEQQKEKEEEKNKRNKSRRNFMANIIWRLKKYLYEGGRINKQKLYDMLVFANYHKSCMSMNW